jgi:hypothetical protein
MDGWLVPILVDKWMAGCLDAVSEPLAGPYLAGHDPEGAESVAPGGPGGLPGLGARRLPAPPQGRCVHPVQGRPQEPPAPGGHQWGRIANTVDKCDGFEWIGMEDTLCSTRGTGASQLRRRQKAPWHTGAEDGGRRMDEG